MPTPDEYRARATRRRNRFAYPLGIFGILLITFSYYAYQIFYTPNVETKGRPTYVVVRPGQSYKSVMDSIDRSGAIIDKLSFRFVAKLMKYEQLLKPGRYELKDGYTNRQLINDLRRGIQAPLKLTFQNIRLRRDLAQKLSQSFAARPQEFDSLLSSNSYAASLGFKDTTALLTMFIPNTYELYYTTPPKKVLKRLKDEYEKFWTPARDAKAKAQGLSRTQVSALASIVEAEQQQHADERPRVAGVYLNRLKRGMKLQADPTVVYANGDFGIRRVLNVHLQKDSPYNTYKYAGLPPGPINLPSIASIDAVLNPEQHNYLYFCAREDFSGYHAFATNKQDHLLNARRYHAALTRSGIMK